MENIHFLITSGVCANNTANNTKPHPTISLPLSCSFKISQPKIAANTDSVLKIIEAGAGLTYFWPIICNVNPIPLAKIPTYKIGSHAANRAPILTSSNIRLPTPENILPEKNCIHDSVIPLTAEK